MSKAGKSSVRSRARRLHWWNRGSGVRLRLWMAVNVLVLSLLSYGVYLLANSSSEPVYQGLGVPAAKPGIKDRLTSGASAARTTVPEKASFTAPEGKYFGLSSTQIPWSSKKTNTLAKAAGQRPTMSEYFVNWNEDFAPTAVDASYRQGMLPVISWQPWAGRKHGTDQPKYALSKIADGTYDAYVSSFAKAVAGHKWPVVIRFAHEMNGAWYPWSEQRSGNHKGDYVKAWQHVHDLFEQAGADNVIWLWSPNILRPVPEVSLAELYPGDDYTDWVGMVGYAVHEKTAAAVFDPTLKKLRKLTDHPIVITEAGAQPGTSKAAWISDFFKWFGKSERDDVIGFIWFERDREQGGGADWRFTENAATLKAFRRGLADIDLTGSADLSTSATPTASTTTTTG
ncbi:glycoside hydrolase family 26 protein [Streptomyces sp. NPDC056628]|uniref:glycoside hydrolase family 26 protein n=1 Tax=Streptomyces sp. NPDC056628 TaxID=3345882 RepID=UPI00368375CD